MSGGPRQARCPQGWWAEGLDRPGALRAPLFYEDQLTGEYARVLDGCGQPFQPAIMEHYYHLSC